MEYQPLVDEEAPSTAPPVSAPASPPETAKASASPAKQKKAAPARELSGKELATAAKTAGGKTVILNSTGQHTLEWDEPLVGARTNTTVPPGKLNLYTYPGEYEGKELELLRSVLLELATTEFFEHADPVGAFPIHALMVCNSKQSLELCMAILEKVPQLLLQTHTGEIFTGEGLLHILCANRQEDEALHLLDIAFAHLSPDDCKTFLSMQATGGFFESAPMLWYGESVLSYACTFGLRDLVLKMLETKMVSLDDEMGALTGFYPIHAVAANGNRGMFDFLVKGLPKEMRADKLKATGVGKLSDDMNLDGMSPLQLAAKRGVRIMFQHIMKTELTTVLWVWGPVTQYQVSLDGIDSATGVDDADVMEVMVRDDASLDTHEFMLDDFMQGFLYTLYEQKWAKIWYMHYLLRALDLSIVIMLAILSHRLKNEIAKESHHLCLIVLAMLGCFLLLEGFIGGLYAYNFKRTVTAKEVMSRTWAWMRVFAADVNLLSIVLLGGAIGLYFNHTSDVSFPFADASSGGAARELSSADAGGAIGGMGGIGGIGGIGGAAGLPAASRSLQEGMHHMSREAVEHEFLLDAARTAAVDGKEPLVWLLMGLGFLLKFYAFVDQFVQPFVSLNHFVLSIRQVLKGDFLTFMSIFLVFLTSATFTMITIFPEHPAAGPLPQAPDFGHWGTAIYAILMVGFTGEPLELNLELEYLAPLGPWQKVSLGVVAVVYVLFIFASLILLLNLLIALLGSSFAKTSSEATLQGRVAFATVVLRLELVAQFFCINTFAGEPEAEGSKVYVHKFRSVVRDLSGELPRHDTQDENVFDRVEEAKVAANLPSESADPLTRLTKVYEV